jgi:gliding motility-associated-like protein
MRILLTVACSLAFFIPLIAQQGSTVNWAKEAGQNGFLKNIGQVKSMANSSVDFVLYQAKISGQQVYVTKYGLAILFSRTIKAEKFPDRRPGAEPSKMAVPDSLYAYTYEIERVDIVLKNASILTENINTVNKPGSAHFNLYDTEGERSSQQLKNEIVIKDVYKGIDWKIYIKDEPGTAPVLKYDFIVHPGADPAQIQIQYSSNADLSIKDNMIHAKTNMAELIEEKPYSYLLEDGTEVPVSYMLKKNRISFNTGNYDKKHTLVIDPSVFWLTYLSTTSQVWSLESIYGNDVETDAAGNIFVQLSAFGDQPFPTVNPGGGAYYQSYTASPNGAMVMMKFAPGGQLLWSTYFGNGVRGRCMSIDKFGNIIAMGGTFQGYPAYPNPNPTIPLLNNGGYYDTVRKSNFICKFSNSGMLLWSSYFTSFSTYPIDMTYDLNGNVYVTGWSESNAFPTVNPGGGAYVVTNQQFGWAQVLFISQFNSSNQLTWSTRIEGNAYDPHARICTDRFGNIYLGGQTRSTNYPLVNAGGYYNTTNWNSVITRFNTARQMTWSTYLPAYFTLSDLTVDDSSNLYITVDKRIFKFNSNTDLVFEKSLTTNRMHFWQKIQYDPKLDQIQLLGQMNDSYLGFPTQNTACNGAFFNHGQPPRTFNSAVGPIFATINHDGTFSYLSLTDWVSEYYQLNEMAVDRNGDMIYVFGDNSNGSTYPNPQLTNPGNGAYFDNRCCYGSSSNKSAMLLKLTASELFVSTQVTQANQCNCDGEITVTPLCGMAPFTYLWNTGATTATVTGLCPGNYWVRVRDWYNLTKTVYVNIPYPPGSMTGSSKNIIPENCDRSNGSIDVTAVQGGVAPYTFAIDGGASSSNSYFTGLDSGRHIIKITDFINCNFYDTVVISRVPGPQQLFYSIDNSSCISVDGVVKVDSVYGGISPYLYSLNSQNSTSGVFNNLPPGPYTLTVQDTAGCSLSRQVNVLQSMPPSAISFTTGNNHCNSNDGVINITGVTGGTAPFMYALNNSAFIYNANITGLSSGSYKVSVKDSKGCVFEWPGIVINDVTGPVSATLSVKDAVCNATGSVLVSNVNGGSVPYSYRIDGGGFVSNNNILNIAPGIHQLQVKDAYNCMLTIPFTVGAVIPAVMELKPGDSLVCYNENIQLTAVAISGQLQNYTWNIPASGNAAYLQVTDPRQVIVRATDVNGCLVSDTAFITVRACNTPDKCLAIPNAFTPNGDGLNDQFMVKALGCLVTGYSLQIYNRYGEVVFESREITEKWSGYHKGQVSAPGAYTYVCTYTGEDNITRTRQGSVILLK